MVRPHTKRPSCPGSSVTLQVLRLRRTRLRMQQAWPSNDPSRPLLYVSVGASHANSVDARSSGYLTLQSVAYGAIARASVTESLLFQSSRGSAAARANIHSRTRS